MFKYKLSDMIVYTSELSVHSPKRYEVSSIGIGGAKDHHYSRQVQSLELKRKKH